MSDPFIGQITMGGWNFAPRGWALCDGQLLSISQNAALFSLLGVTYGGDGRTTFQLPDLQGRFPMHPGTGGGLSPRKLGQRGGTETVTLDVQQMPTHAHTVNCRRADGDNANPVGNVPARSSNRSRLSWEYSHCQPSVRSTAPTQDAAAAAWSWLSEPSRAAADSKSAAGASPQ